MPNSDNKKQNTSLEPDGRTWVDDEEDKYRDQLLKQKKLSFKLLQVLLWLKDNALAKIIILSFGAVIGFYVSQSHKSGLPQSQKQKNITQQPYDDP